jgi:hypothetical protein
MSSIRDFCKQLKKSIVSQILMGSENLLQLTSEVAGGVKEPKMHNSQSLKLLY